MNNKPKKILSAHDLIANWYQWNIDSPGGEKIKVTHTALYFYIVNLAKQKNCFDRLPFDSKTIRNDLNIVHHHNYFRALDDLIELGFLQEVNSENSYDPKMISLEYSEELAKEIGQINKQEGNN